MPPIKPYTAVGLIPTVRGIRKRADIRLNLEHLKHLVKAAAWLSSLDLPVRLIAIPEGALQGFNDEVLDLDHTQFAREGAIDIPGEETAFLGRLARFKIRMSYRCSRSIGCSKSVTRMWRASVGCCRSSALNISQATRR